MIELRFSVQELLSDCMFGVIDGLVEIKHSQCDQTKRSTNEEQIRESNRRKHVRVKHPTQ